MAIILITGAARGLGRGLVGAYLAQSNNTVIAAVRNTSDPNAVSLSKLPKGASSTLILITIDIATPGSALAAVSSLEKAHGITHLDLVISNAAIAKVYPLVSEAKAEDMAEHYAVNVIGTVLLFQAVLPLLLKAKLPKLVNMSSSVGALINLEKVPFQNAAYAPTKTVVNWISKKTAIENPTICVIAMDPGWVQTDMGNFGARNFGIEKAALETDESVQGMVKVIDAATLKDTGKLVDYKGDEGQVEAK